LFWAADCWKLAPGLECESGAVENKYNKRSTLESNTALMMKDLTVSKNAEKNVSEMTSRNMRERERAVNAA